MSDSQDTTPLARIENKLERIDELIRNVATRAELENLRRDVVQTAVLDPQLSMLRTQIAKLEQDRQTDRTMFEKRLEDIEKEQISRSDRLWARFGPIIAAIALLLSFLQFFSHIQIK